MRITIVTGNASELNSAMAAIGGAWTIEADRAFSDRLEVDVAALRELLRRHPVDWAIADPQPKLLFVCDMDSTIIGCETLDELADYAGKRGEIAAITERAMRGELDFEAALQARVAMLAGLSLEMVDRCYRERVRLNPGARALLAGLKAQGVRCVLATGGFEVFAARVAAEAGFDACYANRLEDDGAALTGRVLSPIQGAAAKLSILEAERAAMGLTPAQCIAMGDGANDAAMIAAAGLGVAYRAKPILAAQANAAIEHGDLSVLLRFIQNG